jgi:UPF0716 protein FxsA
MVLFLVLFLIAFPILELYVGSLVADQIGLGPTLLAVLAAAILGVWVIRIGWRRRPRGADTALLVVAGLLLVFPGFITDALGLVLLLPPVRAVAKVWIGQRVDRQLTAWNLTVLRWDDESGRVTRTDYASGDVVTGEVVREDPPERPRGEIE